MNKVFAGVLVSALALAVSTPVLAQAKPIKIGEINSYSNIPQFTTPYRQGWQLALEEVNANGGLLGRKVEVIARDDGGNQGPAFGRQLGSFFHQHGSLHVGARAQAEGVAVAFFPHDGIGQRFAGHKQAFVFLRVVGKCQAHVG